MRVKPALAATAAVAVLMSHGDAHALLQEGSIKIFENERVVIWNLASDTRPAMRDERLPGVLVSLADGAVRLTDAIDMRTPRERVRPSDDRKDDSGRAVLIELKDYRVAPLAAPRGVARAFPRQGAKRVIENDRIAVWDLTWTTGMKTAVHFHDKDVVAIYLGAGTVRSIPLEGEPTATPRSANEALFLSRGRTHVEECIDGPRRDIIIELKH